MTRVRAPAVEATIILEEGCSLLRCERGARDGGCCQAVGGGVLHGAQLHGLWALGGGRRWAHGYWIRDGRKRWAHGWNQWVAAVGVVGDVVHLLGEGHQGLEVLAIAAVEMHLCLDVGFEAPHEGAPLLSCAQVRDLQHQLVEGGDVMGHRAGLAHGREPIAHYVIVRGRGVPGGELAGEGGPVQPHGEASTLPGGAQGAQPLGVGVSQVGAGDHNPLVRGGVAGRVVDVCRPEELGDLRWGGVPLGGSRRVLEPERLGGSRWAAGQRLLADAQRLHLCCNALQLSGGDCRRGLFLLHGAFARVGVAEGVWVPGGLGAW